MRSTSSPLIFPNFGSSSGQPESEDEEDESFGQPMPEEEESSGQPVSEHAEVSSGQPVSEDDEEEISPDSINSLK